MISGAGCTSSLLALLEFKIAESTFFPTVSFQLPNFILRRIYSFPLPPKCGACGIVPEIIVATKARQVGN
jgi:hypothetical protein